MGGPSLRAAQQPPRAWPPFALNLGLPPPPLTLALSVSPSSPHALFAPLLLPLPVPSPLPSILKARRTRLSFPNGDTPRLSQTWGEGLEAGATLTSRALACREVGEVNLGMVAERLGDNKLASSPRVEEGCVLEHMA